NHTELTPNAMLRYNINNRQNITVNYSLVRQSPASSLVLNSTPVYDGDDTTQVFLGNPGLKSYYVNSLHLDYEFFIPEKFYTGLSLHHNSASNAIVQKKYLDNGIHYTTYINAANYRFYSAYVNFNFYITKWWKISLNGSANRNEYKDAESALNKKYTSYSAWFDNSIKYKSLSVYFSYFPSIKNPTLTGYYKRDEYSNLTVSYRPNRWTFAIQTYCMFSPGIKTTETYSDGFSQIYTQNNRNQHLRVTLRVGYYLQKGKQQADKQKRSKQYNDEIRIDTK
ncbi:MAG: outer membrane beta-barrel family protein, partial [Prevotellaceae bacterium]|nr:outer membrane beta-barrel family protein [Prevotellaceae bacterium]